MFKRIEGNYIEADSEEKVKDGIGEWCREKKKDITIAR